MNLRGGLCNFRGT